MMKNKRPAATLVGTPESLKHRAGLIRLRVGQCHGRAAFGAGRQIDGRFQRASFLVGRLPLIPFDRQLRKRSSEQPSTGQLVSISARSARPGDATSSGGNGWLQRYVSVLRQAKLPPFRRTIVGRRLPSSRGGRPVVGPSFRTFLRSRTLPLRLECLGDCKADQNRPRTRVAAIPQSPAYSNAKAGRYQLPTIPIGWWRTLIVRRERGWAVNRGPT